LLFKDGDLDEAEKYFKMALNWQDKYVTDSNRPGINMLNELLKMSRLFQSGYVIYTKLVEDFEIDQLLDFAACPNCDK
jgi:hypothetical protein